MKNISIVVPIFHGRKYIESMIAQLEKCAGVCEDKYALELIFVNDDPQVPIGEVSSNVMMVRVLETDENRGIHGARVRGVGYCTGEYYERFKKWVAKEGVTRDYEAVIIMSFYIKAMKNNL